MTVHAGRAGPFDESTITQAAPLSAAPAANLPTAPAARLELSMKPSCHQRRPYQGRPRLPDVEPMRSDATEEDAQERRRRSVLGFRYGVATPVTVARISLIIPRPRARLCALGRSSGISYSADIPALTELLAGLKNLLSEH